MIRLMLVTLLLAVAAPHISAQSTSSCFTDPTASACSALEIDSTVTSQDLQTLCQAAAQQMPAACSIYSECLANRGSGADCQPFLLVRTVCADPAVKASDACTRYTKLCSAGSVVPQCKDPQQQPITLPAASSLARSVSNICSSALLSPCNFCTRQSCQNPFGVLAQLCVTQDFASCVTWKVFCSSTAGALFVGLCTAPGTKQIDVGAAVAAPVPAVAPAADLDVASPSAAAPKAATSMASSPCYTDPTQDSCASFKQTESDSLADINILCSSMPNMVGCTVFRECENGTAPGRFCTPFSVLGDLCLDMPSMRGCGDWHQLCDSPDSKVEQCAAERPIRAMLFTTEAQEAVLQMCSSHSMPGCEQCTGKWSLCPDPLAILSKLCLGMPGMVQCSKFYSMCQEAGEDLPGLCGASASGDLPPMKMYLHTAFTELILLRAWVPTTPGLFIASCLAIIAMGLLVQALKGVRVSLEAKWARALAGSCCVGAFDDDETADKLSNSSNNSRIRLPLIGKRLNKADVGVAKRNLIRGLFTFGIVWIDYMLMLVVMTFNIGLIISAVLGFALGAVFFGHLGEPRPKDRMIQPAVGTSPSDPDDGLDVHFVDSTTCCNGSRV